MTELIHSIQDFFTKFSPVQQAVLATTATWLLTALGASFVFFVKTINQKFMDLTLGFAGGVMLAASYWSLLEPAIHMSNPDSVLPVWFPAASGFILGALFLYLLNFVTPHLHLNTDISESEGPKTKLDRTILLVLAITLHNIPEGLAIGVAFGALSSHLPSAELGSAIALAIGIGIQNIPEGTAVAMPLRVKLSRFKSFYYGQLSGIVEPVAGFAGALLVIYTLPILPYLLAFAAGAMIFIVVEEVIPESLANNNKNESSIGFLIGFVFMMILDVALS